MQSVSTALLRHEEHRVVPCFLCRSLWEERLIGVGLLVEDQTLGDLCPRCLAYTPRQNATWLREYSESLRRAVEDLREPLQDKSPIPQSLGEIQTEIIKVVQSTARLQQMTALLRRGTRDLKNHFSRTRRLLEQIRQQASDTGDDEFTPFLTGELDRLNRVLSITPQMLKLPEWQHSVDEVMRSEKEILVTKLSIDERSAAASVSRRYREFLVRSA